MQMIPYNVDDYNRYILFTNLHKPVIIETEERRFFITVSSSPKLPESQVSIYTDIKSDRKSLRMFFNYLQSIPITRNYSFEDNRPLSVSYNRLKDTQKSFEGLFLSDFLLDNCYTPHNKQFYNSIRIDARHFFELFKSYQTSHNFKSESTSVAFKYRMETFLVNPAHVNVKYTRSQDNKRDRDVWFFNDVVCLLGFLCQKDMIEKKKLKAMEDLFDKYNVPGVKDIAGASAPNFIN